VQLRAFLSPLSGAASVKQEMAKFYEGTLVPPLSLVEWESSLPIEIELLAMVPAGQGRVNERDAVAYVTPPGMSASPVFSRVARVRGDRTVYISGLYAHDVRDAEVQVRDVFDQLGHVLNDTGSDFRHLVKATYYVSDADASAKLNAVRPDFYDPARPPAASKAMVRGVGRAGRTMTLDMIAVTPRSE
jgi:enamine deaminase RidA (YjgF/YER057c/UK114 family)